MIVTAPELQERVALYLRFLWMVFGTFYLVDTSMGVRERGWSSLTEGPMVLHGLLVLSFLIAWLLVGRRQHGEALLTAVEIGATLTLFATAAAMVALNAAPPSDAGPAFAIALAQIIRASIVPSSGRRTLLLGAAATIAAFVGYFNAPTHPRSAPVDFVTCWTLAFALSSAQISKVIYGLRQQINQAQRLGQYLLERKIGEGAMGAVYEARHALLRRPTAVKLILPAKVGAVSIARFEQEVRMTARLSHPNTVTIFDYGRTPDGVFYYAMELLDGANLDDIVEVDGPQTPARTLHVLARAADALSEAHGAGLIHRDIKPANIMLCTNGGRRDVPKLVDFGLVKDLGSDVAHTQADVVAGTPLYMAPEAISSPGATDARSDLYALGAVGYFLLTGQHVFEGKTVVEVCAKHLHSAPVPPSERIGRPLPSGLEKIILECLAKEPDQRPQTAAALRDALLALEGIERWNRQRADEWWQAHGGRIVEKKRRSAPSESGRTMDVALNLRS